MKKLIGFIILLGFAGIAKADELASLYDVNRHIHFEQLNVNASTNIILVDLSDTVNWPHERSGSLGISNVRLSFVANAIQNFSSGTVKIGVWTYVDQGSGTVSFFKSYPFYNTSTATVVVTDFMPPIYNRTQVTPVPANNGSTRYFITNSSGTFQSAFRAIPMASILNNSVTPSIGDLLLQINVLQGNLISFVLDMDYMGVKP